MTMCQTNDQFKNCPKYSEDKIPQSTTEFFTKNSSVAYEPCDRQLSKHVIKSHDLKCKALLFLHYDLKNDNFDRKTVLKNLIT